MTTFEFDDGKYKLVRDDNTFRIEAFRHGERWEVAEQQFLGNKLLHSMLFQIEELDKQVSDAYDAIFQYVPEAKDEHGNLLTIADKINRLTKQLDKQRYQLSNGER